MPGWDRLEVVMAEYSRSSSIFNKWRIDLILFTHKEKYSFQKKSHCRQLASAVEHYNTSILEFEFVCLMNIFKEIFILPK